MEEAIDEIREKAKVVAEATGRSIEAVIDDLMDDGIVNLSNEENKEKNLVEQLKEAAELITTVQSISQEVSENTVLNGGENSTEVKVETTLEGDIVDRTIQSLQRKADNIKKLGLTLIPIFLLITGGSMEAIGIIDLMPTEENGMVDDGCDPMWKYDDNSWHDAETIYVSFSFYDESECGIELEGHFVTYIFRAGEDSNFDASHHNVGYFVNVVDVNFEINDLESGDYWIHYEFHDINCEDGTCEHGDEWFSPHTPSFTIIEPEGCDAYLINEQAYILESDPEKVRISADVAIVQGEENCDSEQFEITWRLYENNVVKYEHKTYESGVISDPDGADYVFHTWDSVSEGSYEPKVILRLNDEKLDEKWISHSINMEAEKIYGCIDSNATNYDSMATDDDGSCEYPPEVCEINLYYIMLETNSTYATISYDLDCGYQQNELEGYNVSVQFLVYEVGSENNTSSQPIVWDTTLIYVKGWEYDNNSLTLTNFTSNNTTNYDFYWYATWTDANDDMKFIERKWLSRELSP